MATTGITLLHEKTGTYAHIDRCPKGATGIGQSSICAMSPFGPRVQSRLLERGDFDARGWSESDIGGFRE